ncbi:hypothetical protein RHO13_00130 [Orbus wheelerorum]|uniref:hypothetical protein n=1 Tax=Orbus wheelerorum TaxID=3074111 RepID=UPI00370DA8CE
MIPMKTIIAIGALFFVANANADKVPLKISTGTDGYKNNLTSNWWRTVTVTSLDDNLIIKKITVDRGNCKHYGYVQADKYNRKGIPISLKFGKKVTYEFIKDCSAIEIQVDTNLGSWTFQ